MKKALKKSNEANHEIDYDDYDEKRVSQRIISASPSLPPLGKSGAAINGEFPGPDLVSGEQKELATAGVKRRAPSSENDGIAVDGTGQHHHHHHHLRIQQNRTKCRRLNNGEDQESDDSGSDLQRDAVSIEDSIRSAGLDPTGGAMRSQGGPVVGDDGDGSSDRDGADEIKNQRPRGLLAQHRLQTTPTAGRPPQPPPSDAGSQTPGTVDLSYGGAREKGGMHNDADESDTDECLNLTDMRGPTGNSTSAPTRRPMTSADSETFDDEDAAVDFDDDDVNEDEDEAATYSQHRGFLGDARLHQTPLMTSSALNFFAGLPGIGIGNGNPSMTSLPPTPTSASMLVGLDYSMHRHHLQQLQQQEQLRHQLQLHQSRFESLMDRRFMPSPPLPTSSFPLPHSPSSGGGSSIDREDACSPASACGSSVGLNGSSSPGGHQRQWTFQEQFKQVSIFCVLEFFMVVFFS